MFILTHAPSRQNPWTRVRVDREVNRWGFQLHRSSPFCTNQRHLGIPAPKKRKIALNQSAWWSLKNPFIQHPISFNKLQPCFTALCVSQDEKEIRLKMLGKGWRKVPLQSKMNESIVSSSRKWSERAQISGTHGLIGCFVTVADLKWFRPASSTNVTPVHLDIIW